MFVVPKLRSLVSACTIVTASAWAPNAFADPITYSEQVIASGSLNGVAFTNASVLLTMYNDTLNVSAVNPASSVINLGTVTVNVAGVGTDTFSNTGFVFDYQVYNPGPSGRIRRRHVGADFVGPDDS
jgi:hypothetical protein